MIVSAALIFVEVVDAVLVVVAVVIVAVRAAVQKQVKRGLCSCGVEI